MAKIIRNEELEDYRDFFDDDDLDDDVIAYADQPSQVVYHPLFQEPMTLRTNTLEGVHGLKFFALICFQIPYTVGYHSVFLSLSYICGAGIACICKLWGEGRIEMKKTIAKKCWPLLKVPFTQLHLSLNSLFTVLFSHNFHDF
jgi:hypothetical protein